MELNYVEGEQHYFHQRVRQTQAEASKGVSRHLPEVIWDGTWAVTRTQALELASL